MPLNPSSSQPPIALLLTYNKVDHNATLTPDGVIHYLKHELESITDFCNQVTNNKANGQVAERIKFITNGHEHVYETIKEKVSAYSKTEKLKAIYCLLTGSQLPEISKKKEPKSSSSNSDPVKEILKQFKSLSLEEKGRCLKLLTTNYIENVNTNLTSKDNESGE